MSGMSLSSGVAHCYCTTLAPDTCMLSQGALLKYFDSSYFALHAFETDNKLLSCSALSIVLVGA